MNLLHEPFTSGIFRYTSTFAYGTRSSTIHSGYNRCLFQIYQSLCVDKSKFLIYLYNQLHYVKLCIAYGKININKKVEARNERRSVNYQLENNLVEGTNREMGRML